MIRKGAVGSYSEYIVAHTDLKRNKIFILLRCAVLVFDEESLSLLLDEALTVWSPLRVVDSLLLSLYN